jgi:chromosome partitioning protein
MVVGENALGGIPRAAPGGHAPETKGSQAVRKLLVASQKGGVGKTTASMNLAAATAQAGSRTLLLEADPVSSISAALHLAQHPQRKPLRELGIDLPGVLVSEVLPGLDILSPYEEGSCSDGHFDDLLRLLGSAAFHECYGCLVVDAPPFLGANPAQLVSLCDEFVIVMRAEAMAYRTLPAFLELVQRSRGAHHAIRMRGILLTLPEGESPGGRWERELRGRFGTRILPEVIPHDEEVSKAILFGQLVVQASPNSPAVFQYRHLVQRLGLAAEGRTAPAARVTSALLAAASSLQAAGVGARSMGFDARVATPVPEARESPPLSFLPHPTPHPANESPTPLPVPEVVPEEERPVVPSRPHRSGVAAVVARPRRSSTKVPRPVLTPAPVEDSPAPAAPVAPSASRAPARVHLQNVPWPLWIVLAAAGGVALRFVRLPGESVPLLVGVGVAALVLVLQRLAARPRERAQRKPAATPQADNPAPRSQPLSDVSRRLNALTRRPTRAYKRDPGDS